MPPVMYKELGTLKRTVLTMLLISKPASESLKFQQTCQSLLPHSRERPKNTTGKRGGNMSHVVMNISSVF